MSSSLKGIEGNPLHFTKRAENYPQHEVKALFAALKESEQRLLTLKAKFNKFDSFSHEPREDNKRNKPARKECDYCKRTGNRLKVMMKLYACTNRETKQMKIFRPSRKDVQKGVQERPPRRLRGRSATTAR